MSEEYNKRLTIKLTPENASKLRAMSERHPLQPSINKLANLAIKRWRGPALARLAVANGRAKP